MSELPPLPETPPHDSGFPGLAPHFRLRPGDLTVVTGIPGHGKTTVVNDIACRMVERHKWRVAFASFEQIPQRDHKRWLRTWYTGRFVAEQSPEELSLADHWIEQNFLFVVPGEDDDVTLEWLVERLSSAVVRHGVKLLIIDPWNEIEHDRPPHLTSTEYTGLALRALKRFARKHQIHLIVVAHPKMLRRDQQGEYPFPSLYDIADSAHWYNRPEVGIVVWRGKDERTIVRIAKARYPRRDRRAGGGGRALRQRAIDLRGGVMGGSKATVDHPAQARHAAGGAADYLSTMSPAGSPAETIDRVVGEVEGLQVRRR
jgi:twinkle protein